MDTGLVKRDLLASLEADPEFRHAWNLENVYTGICFQIRALREQRGLSQAALGKAAKMAQERISILEDPNADTKPTLNTLLRIADAYDVGLDVRFVPYGTVLDRSTHTNLKELEVPSFVDELPMLRREGEDAPSTFSDSYGKKAEAIWQAIRDRNASPLSNEFWILLRLKEGRFHRGLFGKITKSFTSSHGKEFWVRLRRHLQTTRILPRLHSWVLELRNLSRLKLV